MRQPVRVDARRVCMRGLRHRSRPLRHVSLPNAVPVCKATLAAHRRRRENHTTICLAWQCGRDRNWRVDVGGQDRVRVLICCTSSAPRSVARASPPRRRTCGLRRMPPDTAGLSAAAGTFCGKRCPNAPRGRSAGGAARAPSGANACRAAQSAGGCCGGLSQDVWQPDSNTEALQDALCLASICDTQYAPIPQWCRRANTCGMTT